MKIPITIFICISISSAWSTSKYKELIFYCNIYTHLKQLNNSLIKTTKTGWGTIGDFCVEQCLLKGQLRYSSVQKFWATLFFRTIS